MSERSFVFGVDLDGVVADFYGGLRPIAAEWLGVSIDTLPLRVSWGLGEWGVDKAPGGYDGLHKFAVMQRELFLNLPPTARAPQVMRTLSKAGVRIRIITHRLFIKYFHKIAVSQTIEWLDRHDIPYWDLCFMQQKTAVGADLYIEDSPTNIERLRAEGQKTIVFSNSTNEHMDGPRANTWDEVLRMVLAEKTAWEQRGSLLP
jgi:5'(3')-deoxyribonucleotidase